MDVCDVCNMMKLENNVKTCQNCFKVLCNKCCSTFDIEVLVGISGDIVRCELCDGSFQERKFLLTLLEKQTNRASAQKLLRLFELLISIEAHEASTRKMRICAPQIIKLVESQNVVNMISNAVYKYKYNCKKLELESVLNFSETKMHTRADENNLFIKLTNQN